MFHGPRGSQAFGGHQNAHKAEKAKEKLKHLPILPKNLLQQYFSSEDSGFNFKYPIPQHFGKSEVQAFTTNLFANNPITQIQAPRISLSHGHDLSKLPKQHNFYMPYLHPQLPSNLSNSNSNNQMQNILFAADKNLHIASNAPNTKITNYSSTSNKKLKGILEQQDRHRQHFPTDVSGFGEDRKRPLSDIIAANKDKNRHSGKRLNLC